MSPSTAMRAGRFIKVESAESPMRCRRRLLFRFLPACCSPQTPQKEGDVTVVCWCQVPAQCACLAALKRKANRRIKPENSHDLSN